MPDKRRKVLYLSRGGDVSGAQRQLYYLLRGMDRRRFIPRVVCTEEGPFLDELREIDVPCTVRRLAGWRKVKHLLAENENELVAVREKTETPEEVVGIMRSGAGFGVILNAEHGIGSVTEAFNRPVIQVDVRDLHGCLIQ